MNHLVKAFIASTILSAQAHAGEMLSKRLGEFTVIYTKTEDHQISFARVIREKVIVLQYKMRQPILGNYSVYVDQSLGFSVTVNFSDDDHFSGFFLVRARDVQSIIWDKEKREFILHKDLGPRDPFAEDD